MGGEREHPEVGPGSSSIGRNFASRGATQLNVIINNYLFTERHKRWLRSLPPEFLDEDLMTKFIQFLEDFAVPDPAPLTGADPMGPSNHTGSDDGRKNPQEESHPDMCVVREGVPDLTSYEDDFNSCQMRYRDESRSILKVLNERERPWSDNGVCEPLRQWLSSTVSAVLTIDGFEYKDLNRGGRPWSTKLAIELIQHYEEQNEAVVYHFFAVKPRERGPWPHSAVENLLSQLIKRSIQSLDPQVVRLTKDDITTHRPAQDDDVKGLWNVFRICLRRAKIRSLVIILDQLDALRGECQRYVDGMSRFHDFVIGLLSLFGDHVVVKILVTNMSLEGIREIRMLCSG